MFGYVTIDKPELKVKDYYRYKAYYCGLCHALRDRFGFTGQMTLSYDMTFVVILLTSLYESKTTSTKQRCVVHPARKHEFLHNDISDYCADMNILLTYYHFLDDWQDDKSTASLLGARALKNKAKRISTEYPRQSKVIRSCLSKLNHCEKNNETNLDLVAGCFGTLMEELFILKEDEWEETLRRLGFFLGKFIYIMDAYDDLEEDLKKGSYNPLKTMYNRADYEERCKEILTMMMAECSLEFEKLPCLLDADILRNILYAGVWTKYYKKQLKSQEKDEVQKK